MKLNWEYSLAPSDDPIRFWRSKVKVTARCEDGEGIHADKVIIIIIFVY